MVVSCWKKAACSTTCGSTIKLRLNGKMQRTYNKVIKRLKKRYALSEQGAKDLVKGCLACVLQNLSFMFPVGLLYL